LQIYDQVIIKSKPSIDCLESLNTSGQPMEGTMWDTDLSFRKIKAAINGSCVMTHE